MVYEAEVRNALVAHHEHAGEETPLSPLIVPAILGGAPLDYYTIGALLGLKPQDLHNRFVFYVTEEGALRERLEKITGHLDTGTYNVINRRIREYFHGLTLNFQYLSDEKLVGVQAHAIASKPLFEWMGLSGMGAGRIVRLLQLIHDVHAYDSQFDDIQSILRANKPY